MRRSLLWQCFLLVSLLLFGCGGYDKLLKSGDSGKQWAAAQRYYESGKYHKASQLLERLAPLSRARSGGDSVFFMLSQCHYHLGDYALAGYSFEQFALNHRRSPFYEEGLFMAGYSHYKASPRPSLDQELTRKAISLLQQYREEYPRSERLSSADTCLRELYVKLMRKTYEGARLYYRQEQYRAAISAFKYSLEKYPLSPYREEQLFLVLKSTYLVARNSVPEKQRERYQQAVDEFLSFISEYPRSRYSGEAVDLYRRSMRFLGKEPDEAFAGKGRRA